MTNHVLHPSLCSGLKEPLGGLPEDVREVLEETAQEVQDFGLRAAAKQDEELLARWKRAGMEVNEPDLAVLYRCPVVGL